MQGPPNTSKYANIVFENNVIKKILETHNKLRLEVASGKATGNNGKLPTASDMSQMYWDEKIAEKAQAASNKCEMDHTSAELRVLGNMKLGENIFWTKTSDKSTDPNIMDWEDGIKQWYSEIKDFNKEEVDKMSWNSGAVVTHFTQLVWSETYLIGCGFCSYVDNDWFTRIYFCQYGPAGNMVGSANYKTGVPASRCLNGFENSNIYPGLCCKKGFCKKDDDRILKN